MNTICTNIRQSKKLIELGLSIKTADMHYTYRHWEIDEYTVGDQTDARPNFYPSLYNPTRKENSTEFHYIPSWSLVALLELMPKIQEFDTNYGFYPILRKGWVDNQWYCLYTVHITRGCDNLLDAAFEMVVWLLENNYIKKGE